MATDTTGTTTATAMVPPGDRPESPFEVDPRAVDSDPAESAFVPPVDDGSASVEVTRIVVASFVDAEVTTLELDVDVSVGVEEGESVEEGVSEAGVLEGAGVLLGSADVDDGSALDEASVDVGTSDDEVSVGVSAGLEELSVGVAAGEEAPALLLDGAAAAGMCQFPFFFFFLFPTICKFISQIGYIPEEDMTMQM